MKVRCVPIVETKTKKGYIYDVLLRDDNMIVRIYTLLQLPLGKEQEVDIKFDKKNIYFVK